MRAPAPGKIEAAIYRSVMGLWPTGVCVVTGTNRDKQDLGMVIGSFTSVSLDPPLICFCPQRSSSSWQEMRDAGRICINVLSEFQSELCWKFAAGNIFTRFAGVDAARNEAGILQIANCTAWIQADTRAEIEAGDHWIVVCEATAMNIGSDHPPMAFAKGKLNRLAPIATLSPDHLDAWEQALQTMHPY